MLVIAYTNTTIQGIEITTVVRNAQHYKRGVGLMAKAQTRAKRKYNEANYYRIALTIPKGLKEPLKEYAVANNTTINRLLNDYVAELLNAGTYDTGTSNMNDTNTSIDYDINSTDDTNTSIQEQSSDKTTKGKPSPQQIESWVKLRDGGIPFRKIAEMPEGGGYGKSAIQRHVSLHKSKG